MSASSSDHMDGCAHDDCADKVVGDAQARGCGCGDGCCGSSSSDATDGVPANGPKARNLDVELLVIDLEVCARCVPTGEQLRTAIDLVTPAADAMNIRITYRETIVQSPEEAKARALLSSPTIRMNGHDIQQDIRESECESCGDLTEGGVKIDCREWHYHGQVYAAAPLPLLVESLMDALARIDEIPPVTPAPLQALPANLVTYFDKKKVVGGSGCC